MPRYAKSLIHLAGWFALAYFGLWGALLLNSLAPTVAFPLAGAKVTRWSASPFQLNIENAKLSVAPGVAIWLRSFSALLDTTFLLASALWGKRATSHLTRSMASSTGLWLVLLQAWGIAALFYGERSSLAHMLRLLLGKQAQGAALWTAAGIFAIFLGYMGSLIAGQLIADAAENWIPSQGSRWWAIIFLPLPFTLFTLGIFNFSLRWLSLPDLAFVLLPGILCAVFAAAGLCLRARPLLTQAPSTRSAVTAVCLAVLLYGMLSASPSLKARYFESQTSHYASEHFDIRYDGKHFTDEFIRTLACKQEKVLAGQAARLGVSLHSLRLRITLFGDFSQERASTGSRHSYAVEGTWVRGVVAGYVGDLDAAAIASALLDAVWGKPGSLHCGEWVARWLAGEWRGRSIDVWTSQIESEVGHYELAALLSGGIDGEISPLVRVPLGSAWIGWVFDRKGLEGVRTLYAMKRRVQLSEVSRTLGIPTAELERAWHDQVAQLKIRFPPADVPFRPLPPGFFFRGMSFAQEAWDSAPGTYVSSEAAAQLREIAGLNANAVSLMPFGFLAKTSQDIVQYAGTGETDEDLSQATWVAHQLGLKVMLKPQLWVQWGRFTGQINFASDAERARWMRSYREFILHYARLAEIEKMDLLCIGNELEGVSRDEAAWRQIIADIRRVYHGPLTYAANWGQEFPAIPFWDALDYAGLNNYYPLATSPSANPDNLRPGTESLAAKLESFSQRWKRPVLFTEVGFPSVLGAAVEPWVEDSNRTFSQAEQAACYEATLRVFTGRAWFRGMFWWKWPSTGTGGGPQDGSYLPLRKSATDVIRAWYARIALAASTRNPIAIPATASADRDRQ